MNGLIHTSICCPAMEATQHPGDDEYDEELLFQYAAAVVAFNLTYAATMTMSGQEEPESSSDLIFRAEAILCHKTTN